MVGCGCGGDEDLSLMALEKLISVNNLKLFQVVL